MPRLRQDPLTGRWVIIAEGREERPNEFRLPQRRSAKGVVCPFCPGHESLTTPEVAAAGRPADARPNTPGWSVRVFPNLFPALRPADEMVTEPSPGADEGLFREQPGRGRHEVVVCTPRHDDHLASLGAPQLTEVLVAVRNRCRDLARDPACRYVLPFANHGPTAGATLAHPHLQIIALPEVPTVITNKLRRGRAYLRRTGRCLLCDLLREEERVGDRLVSVGDDWLVWAPWASGSPWEMVVTSRRHAADFRDLAKAELQAGAEVLSRALAALNRIYDDPPLNLVFHSAPLATSGSTGYTASDTVDAEGRHLETIDAADAFHWHLEILPRLTRLAGFEVGTGFGINSVAPETAARRLREEGS